MCKMVKQQSFVPHNIPAQSGAEALYVPSLRQRRAGKPLSVYPELQENRTTDPNPSVESPPTFPFKSLDGRLHLSVNKNQVTGN